MSDFARALLELTAANRPLLVLPLPVDARLSAAVLLTVCDWWQQRYGEPLMLGTDAPLTQEDTPYGRALVLRDKQQEVDPDGR
jgi:hypothetical protein